MSLRCERRTFTPHGFLCDHAPSRTGVCAIRQIQRPSVALRRRRMRRFHLALARIAWPNVQKTRTTRAHIVAIGPRGTMGIPIRREKERYTGASPRPMGNSIADEDIAGNPPVWTPAVLVCAHTLSRRLWDAVDGNVNLSNSPTSGSGTMLRRSAYFPIDFIPNHSFSEPIRHTIRHQLDFRHSSPRCGSFSRFKGSYVNRRRVCVTTSRIPESLTQFPPLSSKFAMFYYHVTTLTSMQY